MLTSSTRAAFVAFAGLATLGAMAFPAQAQRPYQPFPLSPLTPQQIPYRVNPNQIGPLAFNNTPQQALYNARMLGRSISAIPPYAYGYNPYPAPIVNYGPVVPPIYNPVPPVYTLSTTPGGTTYPTGSTLSTSPYGGYGLSTVGSGFGGGYGYGGYGYGGDYSSGGTLQGLASYTQAAGQYQIQIQQSSLMREQRRQMALDTARKEAQLIAYLDSIRLTYPQMVKREADTDLGLARGNASSTEIWSGKALNVLLRSVQGSGRNNLARGPKIELESDSLAHINLTDKASQSNAGLLKSVDVKSGNLVLNWPAALEGAQFEESQKRLTLSLRDAVDKLKKGDRPSQATLKDIQADFDTLKRKLDESEDLTPSESIAASRYLKQLDQAVKAIRDPKAANHFNATWKARGANVAELVENMTKDGLEFASATPGDEASYTALYQALRAFEGGLQIALNTKQ